MIIDSHLHIGLMGTTESSLLTYLDQQGIDKCWLLTWEEAHPPVPMLYQPLDLEDVRKAWKNHPDRIVPFYAPDPGRTGWKDALKRCLDEGFAGCGELKVAREWDDPHIEELLSFLNENKLPLVFHSEQSRMVYQPLGSSLKEKVLRRLINERTNGKFGQKAREARAKGILKQHLDARLIEVPSYLSDLGKLNRALENFRDVKFVAHGPHFWNNFGSRSKNFLFHETGKVKNRGLIWDMLEANPNLFCDISGFSGWNALQRDKDLSREFLESFNTHILFGTDNFRLNQKHYIETLNLTDKALDNIMHGNAEKLTSQ